jgi:hypothetical protein
LSDSYAGIHYDIVDAGAINVLHSRAGVWHTVRSYLTVLHRYSRKQHHVGFQFGSVFGQQKGKLQGAPSREAAALALHCAVVKGIKALDIPKGSEPEHARLRDNLVKTFTSAGQPVSEPFELICGHVADKALAWYGHSWPSDVNLKIQRLGCEKAPYFPNEDFWIRARTVLPAGLAVAPTVVLRITPEELNLQTYAAIFAVLVHEFVCHVPAPRGDSSNESPFAEGFCDWAAKQLFYRWLNDLKPALFAAAARRFGEEIWALGMAEDGGNPFWDVRNVGHDAAANVVAVFQDAGLAVITAIDQTIVLARDLTLLDAPLVSKDNFVRRLAGAETEDVIRDRLNAWSNRRASVYDVLPPY